MKKIILASALLLTSIISNRLNAQNSATETANASVTLISPISITKASDLNFGTFVAGETSGTITMTPSGTISTGGGVTEISGGDISAATFTVAGEMGQSYAITLPSSDVILRGFTEGEFVTLNTFTSNPTNTGVIGTDTTIAVGGTLTVPANSEAATYTGTFDVIVNYN